MGLLSRPTDGKPKEPSCKIRRAPATKWVEDPFCGVAVPGENPNGKLQRKHRVVRTNGVERFIGWMHVGLVSEDLGLLTSNLLTGVPSLHVCRQLNHAKAWHWWKTSVIGHKCRAAHAECRHELQCVRCLDAS